MSQSKVTELATVHLINWHAPHKTACNVKLTKQDGSLRLTTLEPRLLTCNRCSLRLLRIGQNHGLSVVDIMDWNLKALRELDLRETHNKKVK